MLESQADFLVFREFGPRDILTKACFKVYIISKLSINRSGQSLPDLSSKVSSVISSKSQGFVFIVSKNSVDHFLFHAEADF